MGYPNDSNSIWALRRSLRTSVLLFVALAALIVALMMLEQSGPAPVRPLLQNASSHKTESEHHGRPPVVPVSDKKPNKHCGADGEGGQGHGRKGEASVLSVTTVHGNGGNGDANEGNGNGKGGDGNGNGGNENGHGKGNGGGDDHGCRPPSGARGGDRAPTTVTN